MANLFNIAAKQHILISFDALFDMDIGLIQLIKEKYASPDVFDLDKLNQSNYSILKSMVERDNINPLYTIAKEDISHNELDEFYKQFLDQEYEVIFDKAIYTDLLNLLGVVKGDNGIEAEIVYYNDKQKELLDKDNETSNIHKVFVKDIYKNDKFNSYKYDFVYLKSLDELLNFPMLESSIIYIARYGFNINEENSDFNENNKALLIFLAVDRNNELGVYEPYNFDNWEKSSSNSNNYYEEDDGIPVEDEDDEGDNL